MAEASDAAAAAVVQPIRVAYCTVSGFPYEYCEFHPDVKKCIAAAAADPALHQYLPIIMNKREASMELRLSIVTNASCFIACIPSHLPPPQLLRFYHRH
jgi:hypothetical protein